MRDEAPNAGLSILFELGAGDASLRPALATSCRSGLPLPW
jgi:hypothetical protein